MEFLLFLALIYVFTFVIGTLLEKIRIPWIFAALILGFMLAIYNPISVVTSSDTFKFLSELGMYFLLFIIGFEIDLREMKKEGKFIIRSTIFIILFECICGMILIHLLFNLSWILSFLVGLSFATVGEAVLLPILDEFKIINTKLGQSIIGIGVLDDAFEVFTLILACILVGSSTLQTSFNISVTVISLVVLFSLAYLLTKMKKEGKKFNVPTIETLFLFVMFIFFLFIGVGKFADASPLGALLAGIALKNFIPKKRLKFIESEIRTICYGLFAPLFFIWVGVTTNISYLVTYPLLVILFFVVTWGSKMTASYLSGKKELGTRKSLLLGIGLSVRFSTSIVIAKYLFESNLIGIGLYSVLVASTALFTFIIPIMFSYLLQRWRFKY